MSRNSRLKATAKRRNKTSKGVSKRGRSRMPPLGNQPGMRVPFNPMTLVEDAAKKAQEERPVIERDPDAVPVNLLELDGGEAA